MVKDIDSFWPDDVSLPSPTNGSDADEVDEVLSPSAGEEPPRRNRFLYNGNSSSDDDTPPPGADAPYLPYPQSISKRPPASEVTESALVRANPKLRSPGSSPPALYGLNEGLGDPDSLASDSGSDFGDGDVPLPSSEEVSYGFIIFAVVLRLRLSCRIFFRRTTRLWRHR